MRITNEHIDALGSDRHRAARSSAGMTAELLREALTRLGFLLDVPSYAIKDGELCWPTLRGEVTVSGQPVITLGRIPLDSANRLADILMRAALEEQTKKATAR